MTTVTKKKVTSDLVLSADPLFCYESAPLYNASGVELDDTAVPDVIGQAVKLNAGNWELVMDTDEASTTGIVVGGPRSNLVEKDGALANGADTPEHFVILARGPAVLRSGQINAADPVGDAFTVTTIQTALEALNIVFRDEPPTTEEQTT